MKKRVRSFLTVAMAVMLMLVLLPTASFAAESDFTIKNGTLMKYDGAGGAVTIPSSVTSIGDFAFQNCWKLTSVTIPNSVRVIGVEAFSGCSSLTSVVIPNSVTKIENRAFSGCTALTAVTIPNSVTSIGKEAFEGTPWLKAQGDFVIRDGTLLRYQGDSAVVTIPSSVKKINECAFKGCTGLTSVTIPSSVTSIGEGAFQDCSNLTSVTIPNSVRNIEYSTFANCTGLTSITIPNSVTRIGMRAFKGCTGLTSVTIPNSVKTIGDGAFSGCTGLTSVTIPDSVTSLGGFSGCTGLTSITIPNSVTTIGASAFKGCTGLTSITIPNSVTTIDPYTFIGCTGLTSVTIPNSVKIICTAAFSGCTGLTSIVIPNSVTEIWKNAFSGCTGLTSITIPDSVTSIGKDAFADCKNLIIAKIPDSVTEISVKDTFRGCTALTSIGYTEKNAFVFNQWAITAEATLRGVEHYVSAQSEKVTNLSNEICAGLTSDYEKAEAIYDWVTDNVEYDYANYAYYKEHGYYKDLVYMPDAVIDKKLTVCEGYANLTRALLQAQGIPALKCVGRSPGDAHAWNAAYINGTWIYIDSTWKDFDIGLISLTQTRWMGTENSTYNTTGTVQASSSTVTVNGTQIDFECYNIGGNNYFKLRDLAAALNSSEKQFNVTWDEEKGAVNILSDQAYEAVGGELTPGDGATKEGQVNDASVYVDGYWVLLSSYNIGGNNYFKLRDLASVLDFGVSWDGTTGTVVIDGNTSYSAMH